MLLLSEFTPSVFTEDDLVREESEGLDVSIYNHHRASSVIYVETDPSFVYISRVGANKASCETKI